MSSAYIDFFLPVDSAWADKVQSELLKQGLALRQHRCIASLARAVVEEASAQGPRMVLLMGAPPSIYSAAAALRRVNRAVAVVAFMCSIDDETLLRAMSHGIDACWPPSMPADVVPSAVLRLLTLARTTQGCEAVMAPAASGKWLLVSRAWGVQGPCGKRVSLTSAERAFVLALAQASGRRLPYGAMSAVTKPPCGEAQPDAFTARRLSVLVSRLRAKFLASGMEMPIRSLRGRGYELCADLQPDTATYADTRLHPTLTRE